MTKPLRHQKLSRLTGDAIAVAADIVIFSAATIGAFAAQHWDRPRSAALIYLLGVIIIGARSGLALGLAAAITASLIYNFLLLEPVFRFSTETADELIPVIAFNLSAIVSGALAGRLKDSVKLARSAQAKNAHLLQLSDELQSAIKVNDVHRIARDSLPFQHVLDLEIFVFRDGSLYPVAGAGRAAAIGGPEIRELPWDEAGGHSATLQLNGSAGEIGFVRFDLDGTAGAADHADLQGIAIILGLAVDRCLLLERLSESEAVLRSEELKTAILSSVSHDLRTPLTAIEAAATSLRAFDASLSPKDRDAMLSTISEQCRKLNRYTANLLDMGRIQAGIPAFMFTEVDIVEILGVVLGTIRESYPEQQIEKHIELDTGIVLANPAMLEQVIRNLIENAIIHGASERPILIGLRREDQCCVLEVVDFGSGITADEQPLVFNKFYRSRSAMHREGNGLGLHIANGFTEAFGGTIALSSPHSAGNGTLVSVRLPMSEIRVEPVAAWE